MDVMTYRGIERLLIVAGAILLIYLGYRLFIFGVTEGRSKLDMKSEWLKITFSGTGPGLVFMVCGTAVLLTAIVKGANLSRTGADGITSTSEAVQVNPSTFKNRSAAAPNSNIQPQASRAPRREEEHADYK